MVSKFQWMSVKSAYLSLSPSSSVLLWDWKRPYRISVFLWIAVHDKLMTALRRSKWSGSSGDCYRCCEIPESVLHIFRDCPNASLIWTRIVDPSMLQEFFDKDHFEWFDFCITHNLSYNSGPDWQDFFIIAC